MSYANFDELISAVSAGEGEDILNPANGEKVGVAPKQSKADLDEAVRVAREKQPEWEALGEEKRNELLMKAADAIEASAEALAVLLSSEQGKPLNGPNARFEVGACVAWTRATASFESPDYEIEGDDINAKVVYRPLGVVGAISPWNWPMMIAVWQIVPALRMGNTVVVKPSGSTPLSVLGLVKVMNEVLPEGVLQVVNGSGLGAALAEHEGVDKIMFTGSTPTGKKIVEASADTLKRLTLELGGNDAGIVLEDADPKAIAEDLFWGAFLNAGQTCAALKRLYVPESIYDEVCDALVEVATNMPMGFGLDEQNVLGPVQNKDQFDIVDRLVKAAKDGGARVLIGGDPDYDAPGYFYPTTLVADIDNDNDLVTEEQFGPVLPIIKYTDLDDAIAKANGLEFGLGSSVWASDKERAREVAARLRAGTTWINSHGTIDPRVPFGGIKESGYGVEFGVEGLKGLAFPHAING